METEKGSMVVRLSGEEGVNRQTQYFYCSETILCDTVGGHMSYLLEDP